MATIIPAGIETKYFAKIEAAFDTAAVFVSADAAPLITLDITPTQEWIKNRERVGSGSLQGEVKGAGGGTWSATMYVKTNGTTVNVEPDIGPLMQAAFGIVSTAGGDVEYKMVSDGSAFTEVSSAQSLQLARHTGNGLYEVINGCWVETFEIEFAGNAENIITVSGGFSSYGCCYGGTTAVSGAHSAAATSVAINARNAKHIRANATVQFVDGSSIYTNSSAGYLVTAVDTTANTITISPGLESGADLADDTIINPFTPAQTLTTNDPLFGTDNWIFITNFNSGSDSMRLTGAKFTLATGIHGLSGEGASGKASKLALGDRSASGEVSVYFQSSDALTNDWAAIIGGAFDGATYPIEVGAGSTAKSKVVVNAAKARFEVSSITVPEAEEATATIGFVCQQGTYGGDELKLSFQ